MLRLVSFSSRIRGVMILGYAEAEGTKRAGSPSRTRTYSLAVNSH